jgi:hypothetical protein
MKSIDGVVDAMKHMPDDVQEEAKDFVRYLNDTRVRKPKGKMKLKWRGAFEPPSGGFVPRLQLGSEQSGSRSRRKYA